MARCEENGEPIFAQDVGALFPAAARHALWQQLPGEASVALVGAVGDLEHDAEVLVSALTATDAGILRGAVTSLRLLLRARRLKGKYAPALKVTQSLKKVCESLLACSDGRDLEAPVQAAAAELWSLWADKDRPDADKTSVEAAAEELLGPFLGSCTEREPDTVANGVVGWVALHAVDRKAACAIMQRSAPFVELLLEKAWTSLANKGGPSERRLVRWAAEAAVLAMSDVSIRKAVVQAGLPVVLDVYRQFSGPTQIRLLQLLATLSLHDEAVRQQIFREVDFLELPREEDEVGCLTALSYLCLHGAFKAKLADGELLGTLLAPLKVDPATEKADPRAQAAYAHFVHHLVRGRDDKISQKRDEYPFNQMTEEEIEKFQQLAETMPAEGRPAKNGEFDMGSAELAAKLRSRVARERSVVPVLGASPAEPKVIAATLKLLCTDQADRRWLVKHGAVAVLLKHGAQDDAAQALAQICIVMDPKLFAYQEALDAVPVLIRLLKHSHELLQFEAAMGLTNLLSLGAEVVERAVQGEAWHSLHDLLFSDNERLNQAGIEGMCNMVHSEKVRELIRSGRRHADLQLLLAFTRHEELGIARAAAGACAMLLDDDQIAHRANRMAEFRRMVHLLGGSQDGALVHRVAVAVRMVADAEPEVDGAEQLRVWLRTLRELGAHGYAPLAQALQDVPDGETDPQGFALLAAEDKYSRTLGQARAHLSTAELAHLEGEPDVVKRTAALVHMAQAKPELQ